MHDDISEANQLIEQLLAEGRVVDKTGKFDWCAVQFAKQIGGSRLANHDLFGVFLFFFGMAFAPYEVTLNSQREHLSLEYLIEPFDEQQISLILRQSDARLDLLLGLAAAFSKPKVSVTIVVRSSALSEERSLFSSLEFSVITKHDPISSLTILVTRSLVPFEFFRRKSWPTLPSLNYLPLPTRLRIREYEIGHSAYRYGPACGLRFEFQRAFRLSSEHDQVGVRPNYWNAPVSEIYQLNPELLRSNDTVLSSDPDPDLQRFFAVFSVEKGIGKRVYVDFLHFGYCVAQEVIDCEQEGPTVRVLVSSWGLQRDLSGVQLVRDRSFKERFDWIKNELARLDAPS